MICFEILECSVDGRWQYVSMGQLVAFLDLQVRWTCIYKYSVHIEKGERERVRVCFMFHAPAALGCPTQGGDTSWEALHVPGDWTAFNQIPCDHDGRFPFPRPKAR